MLSRLICRLNRNKTRLTWPGLALMMLLQRTPIPWLVAELQFSMGPRMVHLLKWVAGAAVTSAFYNTVTGATGDLSTIGNTIVVEGSNMQVAIRAEKAIPVTVRLEGDLPPGIISNISEDGHVFLGTIAFSGIATVAGSYPIRVTVLTWEDDSTYDGEPVSIRVDFNVTQELPDIIEPPQSLVVPFGATAELSVVAADPEGSTYQWQRNVGASLEDFDDVDGAINSVYSIPNATPELSGAYRVVVSKNNFTVTSNFVFLTVNQVTDFDSWKNEEFAQPNSEDAQPLANPDGDSFSNAFEFLFDLDPLEPESLQVPKVSHEQIGQVDYVVFEFPTFISFSGLSYTFERTSDLKNGPWTEMIHGIDDVIIETTQKGTVLKMPYESEVFCRLKMDTGL